MFRSIAAFAIVTVFPSCVLACELNTMFEFDLRSLMSESDNVYLVRARSEIAGLSQEQCDDLGIESTCLAEKPEYWADQDAQGVHIINNAETGADHPQATAYRVVFQVDEVLNGAPQSEFVLQGDVALTVPSATAAEDDFDGHTAPEFWELRADGRSPLGRDACVNWFFSFGADAQYLVFADHMSRRRSAERIESSDDEWLTYVRNRYMALRGEIEFEDPYIMDQREERLLRQRQEMLNMFDPGR